MIVADSNVIAYCWLNSPMTALAQRVRVKDPDWRVPVLWRSEMRSILAGYLRDGSLSATQARRIMRQVAVKVIDIFRNDTMTLIPVTAG